MENKELSIFEFNGAKVSFKDNNGESYINANNMAKIYGKKIDNWTRLKSTKDYLKAFNDSDLRFRSNTNEGAKLEPIITVLGGDYRLQGTWMHKMVAEEFYRWVSKPKEKYGHSTYVIQGGDGLIKIGKASDIAKRFKAILSCNPRAKILHIFNKDIEQKLHDKYKEFNVGGEWFELSEKQISKLITNK
jgi:hypothetical protein